jgi:hypothetical protein
MNKYIKLCYFAQLRGLKPEWLWAIQCAKSKFVNFRAKNQIFNALSYVGGGGKVIRSWVPEE